MKKTHRIPLPNRAWRLMVLALVTGLSTGCSDLAAKSPLADARRSPEALARAALVALEADDAAALAALRLSKEEWRTLLWPDMPDRHQMPFEFAWSITDPRARKAQRKLLEEYRGIPLELVRVDLGDRTEAYDDFVLHQDARMWVRRTDTGEEGILPLMDTIVEMGGGWKFMNFREHL